MKTSQNIHNINFRITKMPQIMHGKIRGFTIIETIVFVVLLSFLITGFIRYSYTIYEQDLELIDDVNSLS